MAAGYPPPPEPPHPYSRRRRAGVAPRPASQGRQLVSWLSSNRLYLVFATVALIGMAGTYVAWTLRHMPDPGKDNVLANSLVVYDRNGKEIEQRNAKGQFYVQLKLAEMGKYGPAATLAAEDRDFYHHGAVRPESILRATVADVRSGAYVQGGSTITQQLVKIQLLTPQKSIFRKVQEVVLAEGLEARYSKDDILIMYLNRVYYGNGAYGLGAAAKTYYNKDARDLDPAQAAYLAGLIQAPSYYDPILHPDNAKARQGYVLDGMVKIGAITAADEVQAANENVTVKAINTAFRQLQAPHFVDYVQAQAERILGGSQPGLKIYTTLDLGLQASAETAVKNAVARLGREGVNNGMLLAADPGTGQILAWVGSASYNNQDIGGNFDLVSQASRPPGSSFKPYVYEAA